MPLYTSSYFKRIAAQNASKLSNRVFSESRAIHGSFDIFLSYNFSDIEIVEGIYWDLTGEGYKVYLDFIIDPDLQRSNVTKATAEKIRNRLYSSKSLIVAMSENAALSKWMPWELGYLDGHTGQCMLLPVSDKTVPPKVFEYREFLLLYPYMKEADIGKGRRKYVVEGAKRYVWLKDAVKESKKPYLREHNIDFL